MPLDPNKPLLASSISQVANYFGVHPRTVKDWLAAGAPPKKDARYDLRAIEEWRAANRKNKSKPPSDEATLAALKKLQAEARIKEADAALKEYRTLLATDHSLVDKVDVERFISHFLTQARRLIEKTEHAICAAVPRKYQQQLREEIKAQHDQYLRNMHGFIGQVADIGDDHK